MDSDEMWDDKDEEGGFNYWIYEDYMMKVALMNLDYFMILKKLIGISF